MQRTPGTHPASGFLSPLSFQSQMTHYRWQRVRPSSLCWLAAAAHLRVLLASWAGLTPLMDAFSFFMQSGGPKPMLSTFSPSLQLALELKSSPPNWTVAAALIMRIVACSLSRSFCTYVVGALSREALKGRGREKERESGRGESALISSTSIYGPAKLLPVLLRDWTSFWQIFID